MKYRFFGTDLPEQDVIDLFLEYDAKINEDLSDMDKIYYPLLNIQRKLIFESKKYQNKITSKKNQFIMIWENLQSLTDCFDAIIIGLKHSKEKYN